MNYDRIFNNFIDKIIAEGTFASREEIIEASKKMLDIIKENKDSTCEELVELIIEDNVRVLEKLRACYPFPGYTVGIKVGNINVKLLGGDIDSLGRKMPNNALFDIASITKFYTQIIAYNLIKDGILGFNDRVQDLDNRFVNVGDLTIGDILSFTTTFMTNGRIDTNQSLEDAFKTLYGVNVSMKGTYNYNDIGMMIIKEVLERLTGLTYKELVCKYITNKFNLKETFLVIPHEKIKLATGSANSSLGAVNDSNALALGGYSGHAGIFASNDDLIKLGDEVTSGNVISLDMLKDAYTEGAKAGRGIMGNSYTSHETGVIASYVDRLENKRSFAFQGSTRTHLNIGPFSTSTILLNPASMSIERALEEEAKINEKRVLNGLSPLSLVKYFTFKHDKIKKYSLIDTRLMLPSDKTVEVLCTSNAILILRLRFLNEVIKEYDRSYTKPINITK